MKNTGLYLLAFAAISVTACDAADNKGGGSNCLTASACCALAVQDEDPVPQQGKEGCVGNDVSEEWCDEVADLAKVALNAKNVDGECLIGLSPDTVTRVPILWVNSTNEKKVAQFDSVTGEQILRVNTWGNLPNRTAVAADGSVWITNRDSYHYIHIGVDGEVVCASEYGANDDNLETKTGYARAAAIDADGNAWIGFFNESQVVKVSSTETDGKVMLMDPNGVDDPIEVDKCKELARLDMETTRPYGLGADGEGFLWAGTLSSGTIAKIDTREEEVVGEYDITDDKVWTDDGMITFPSFYGMTIDFDGNPWFGSTGGGHAFKVDRETGELELIARGDDPMAEDALRNTRSLGIDTQGHIWAADNTTKYVHEFLSDGTYVKAVDVSCPNIMVPPSGLLGIGSDIDGNMWVISQNGGYTIKFTTDGEVLGCYPMASDPPVEGELLVSPYTYSDLTGSTNALVTSQLGRWRAVVERDEALQWGIVAYQGDVPENTSVCVRLRVADDKDALQTAGWSASLCDPVKVGDYFIHNLIEDGEPIVAATKYMEIELQLNSTDATATPSVKNFSVAGLN